MYGNIIHLRSRAGAVRADATDLRARAASLLVQAESMSWSSSAGDALRARVRDVGGGLGSQAQALDDAATALEAHVRAVEEVKQAIQAAAQLVSEVWGRAQHITANVVEVAKDVVEAEVTQFSRIVGTTVQFGMDMVRVNVFTLAGQEIADTVVDHARTVLGTVCARHRPRATVAGLPGLARPARHLQLARAAMSASELNTVNLSLDELLLVQTRVTGLVLPNLVRAAETPTATAEKPAPSPHDEQTLTGLLAHHLGDPTTTLAEQDWTARVSPELLAPLALQMSGEIVFRISAWSPTERTEHSSTVTDGACSGLTVVTPRPAGPQGAQVVVTLSTIDQLWSQLAAVIPKVVSEPTPVRGPAGARVSATLGLVESRAMIAAIRSGDRRVAEALTAEFRAGAARELLTGLAGPVETGFRVKAFTPVGGCAYSRDWFHGENGWLTLALSSPSDGLPTAELLLESGTLRVTRVSAADIRIDLLGVVAAIIRESYAAV